ncbi:hypothetical protein DKE44_005900 [Acinetobacter nosocomialis]|uniref:hypothetical protein n=1 Tax=Acinetobacter nosocomialis TaxID=106654 RepID=UPI000E2B5646|nr:hypothetical protein DKE44_005900 [Acinetobacter nosocomialis]
MKKFKREDVVKHVNLPFEWKVISSTEQWVKVERKNENGQRIVEEFASEYLELVARELNRFVLGR